jgi:hypothetical protein
MLGVDRGTQTSAENKYLRSTNDIVKYWKLLNLTRGADSIILGKNLVALEHPLALLHIPNLY